MERALCLPFDTTWQGRLNSNFTYIAFSHNFFKKKNKIQNKTYKVNNFTTVTFLKPFLEL